MTGSEQWQLACRGSCRSSWQRRLCETLSCQVAWQWRDVVDLVVMTVSRNGPLNRVISPLNGLTCHYIYIHYTHYNLRNNSFAIMFILYGMSSAWAVLVHIVTSLKHCYFSGESLVYPSGYGGGCICICINHPICSWPITCTMAIC